jgi:hypothetical protein
MTANDLPILMALFWYGFSLPYVLLVWLRRLNPQWGSIAPAETSAAVPFILRFMLSVLGVVGAFGAASIVARLRHQIPDADWVCLAGSAVGILLAYLLHLRKAQKHE